MRTEDTIRIPGLNQSGNLLTLADRIIIEVEQEIIAARHFLHQHPELSCHERETAAFLREKLRAWDIPYETNDVANTVATITGTRDAGSSDEHGKTIALRADLDALPVQEETGLSFASCQDGVMHACGHDCHAAILLGTALALKQLSPYFAGTVKLVFQEAEETGEGALLLLESGLLDGVDRIAGLHVTGEADLGVFRIGYGIRSAIGRGAKLTFTGGSASARMLAVTQSILSLSALAKERFSPEHITVLVPTVVRARSEEETASVTVNFRTLHPEDEAGFEQIIECASEAALPSFSEHTANRARTAFHFTGRDEGMVNDAEATDLAIRVLEETFGRDAVQLTGASIIGEDFAFYQKVIPGVFCHIGGAANRQYAPLHSGRLVIDDGVLELGMKYFTHYALAFLGKEA